MSDAKYYRVSEVARETGLKEETVRNYCHARGANFAYRIGKNGKFLIDLVKFRAYIERHRDYKKEVYLFTSRDKQIQRKEIK